MNRLPLFCLALLFATVITLQATAPQNHIVYLAAPAGLTKFTPVEIAAANEKVLSLEEAVARYEEKHGPITNEPDDYDYNENDCLLGSCALDAELFLVKLKVKYLLKEFIG